MTAPIATPEAGWEPVEPFPSADDTFLSEGDRVRLAYFRKPDEPILYAKAWFGSKTMGPPGHVHGGAMAATLDEAMGAVCWMNGHPVVAATHHDFVSRDAADPDGDDRRSDASTGSTAARFSCVRH